MEVNPLVITNTAIYILDFAAKLDSAADYIFQAERASLEYPAPFGRWPTPEEAKILEMHYFSFFKVLLSLIFVWTFKFSDKSHKKNENIKHLDENTWILADPISIKIEIQLVNPLSFLMQVRIGCILTITIALCKLLMSF